MLYQAFFDIADTSLGLGTLIISDGAHSNIIIDFAELLGGDADDQPTPIMMHSPIGEYSIRTRDGLDTEVSRKLSRQSFAIVLAANMQVQALANGWDAPAFLGAGIDADTGLMWVGYVAGSIDISLTFSTAAGAALMGYAFPQTFGGALIEGIAVPSYVIRPTLRAVSHLTPDRESERVASFAISDDGRHGSGLSREGCSVERDWVQAFEPIAKVEPINATSAHPWTHRHLFRHCRTGLPFVVTSGGFGNPVPELFHLRSEGTAFEAKYVTPDDYRTHLRSVDYRTYVFGAIIAD